MFRREGQAFLDMKSQLMSLIMHGNGLIPRHIIMKSVGNLKTQSYLKHILFLMRLIKNVFQNNGMDQASGPHRTQEQMAQQEKTASLESCS
jgi:hypothetical protein